MKKDSVNRSTLSLHIAAYENSIKISNSDERDESNLTKNTNETSKDIKGIINESTLTIQNPFEFPRQQENQKNKRGIMQFKSSQRLYDPNQQNAENLNPGRRRPSLVRRNAMRIG
uniref:Uncharacterized protein n=1 Tax=Panagrolaimus davidi TaxID=227884 RepID=A0A914Q3I0_9BILA